MNKKSILITLAALFFVGLVSAGLVYKFVINKPHVNYAKAKPEYIVSASDLYNSFVTDRQTAEQKYNGKVVLLNGKLDNVDVTDSLVTGVFVFDQGMFGDEGIRCSMLADNSDALKSVSRGSEVRIKGFLTGYNETDVIIEECSLVR
jgi:hypothetical protein